MFFRLSAALAVFQVTQALTVYLHPHKPVQPRSTQDASAILSHHLGLEMFEPYQESPAFDTVSFIGEGPKSSVIIAVHEADAESILPPVLKSSFELSSSAFPEVSPILSTFAGRAKHAYDKVIELDSSSEARRQLSAAVGEKLVFAVVDLSELAETRHTYGKDSQEYSDMATDAAGLLNDLAHIEVVRIAVLTYPTHAFYMPGERRAEAPRETQEPFPSHPSPQHPIDSISTCHSTVDACNNSTLSCSGRGQCVKATKERRSCFVCACGTTVLGDGKQRKTTQWAGESCERKDVSGPFVLFLGTGVVLLLLVYGSISLLSSIGDTPLPSTLMGTAVNAKRD